MSLAGGLVYNQYFIRRNASDCLGIFGFVGNQAAEDGGRQAEENCLRGLRELSINGYDSCGLASLDTETNRIVVTKHAQETRYGGDCLQKLALDSKALHKSNLGIAHTRWATHGAKTDVNAHPHTDHKGRIALIHNGIIENYQLLKENLAVNHGISPISETDSEILALLIGLFLDQENSIVDSIKKTCLKLIGSYNIALIYNADPDAIYAIRNSGELSIAKDLAKGHSFLCSDVDVLRDEFNLSSF